MSENIDTLDNESVGGDNDMALTGSIRSYLSETAKWTQFISIVWFVMIGFMVLFALFFGSMIQSSPFYSRYNSGGGSFVTITYIIMAVVYFFPAYYLYNFSVNMKSALNVKSLQDLDAAFKNLKSHYKFMGILTIIGISLFILFFLMGVVAGASGGY